MAVRQIAFHLTDRCQLDCQHCLRDPAQQPADLPFDLFERALDEAQRVYRTMHVALTGGEPTLHPRFADAIDAIAARGMTWHMVSNGRTFDWVIELFAARASRRQSLTMVNFSLDGADEAVHDRIRGDGSFRDVMKAVSLATGKGIPFLLQMVLNAHNQHQIEAMGLLASQLGAARLSFAMLQASGTQHDAALYLSPDEWQDVQDRIERIAAALTLEVITPEGFRNAEPFHVCESFRSEQLHIDVAGRLNLCCQHSGIPHQGERSDVAADLRDTSLADGHVRLLQIIHDVQTHRVRALADGALTAWDEFPCNFCLKHFGKPHWSDSGADGPEAARERWRGAWGEAKGQAPAKRPRLPIVE